MIIGFIPAAQFALGVSFIDFVRLGTTCNDSRRVPAPQGKKGDLATHTSGLPLRPTNLVSKDPNDKYQGYSVDLMYECLSSFTLSRDIGTKYEYSNLGYGLLGHVLEKRMGKTYGDLVETRITQPLKMEDTRIDLTRR